jgi:hypothetical protein
MKIYMFTIRSKDDNSLIYAEGAQHDEYYSNFKLDRKWLTQDDLTKRNAAWYKRGDFHSFDEEVRHLSNYDYDLVKFTLEEIEVQ